MASIAVNMPPKVLAALKILNAHGYQAYIVGGCVRDSLLSRKPNDWDITTNAKPDEIKRLFDKTIDTGIKHGTVTVVLGNQSLEITTYRIEGIYSDHRRPDYVKFTSSLRDDLSRRDLTINAIAFHPEEGFIDPYGGINDIHAHIIRTVGNADERFSEDALRMLRVIRFSAQLNFDIHPDTLQAIKQQHILIEKVSHERISDELTKILTSPAPAKFILLRETCLLKYILPEWEPCFDTAQNNPYHIYDVAMHSMSAVSNIRNDRILRWVMLLHDIGKPLTKTTDERHIDHFYGHPEKSVQLSKEILKRLRFDNGSIDKICRLIKYHDRQIIASDKAVRKAANAVGLDIFAELLEVKAADCKGQNPLYLTERLHNLQEIKRIYLELLDQKQFFNIKDLAINGEDLLQLGFKQGKEIGKILDYLLDTVMEDPRLNNREDLLLMAQKMSST